MPKFLNTNAASYFLEDLFNSANERIFIISPFLKINERFKQIIEDKNRFKIDIRIIYGKNELSPSEIEWLQKLDYVRTSFCQNLHAKCYLSESQGIITSLNLYEFSQVNNFEMGVWFSKENDKALFAETYEEAMRIVRASEEVRITAKKITEGIEKLKISLNNIKDKTNSTNTTTAVKAPEVKTTEEPKYEKLTTSKLAQKLKLKTGNLNTTLKEKGFIIIKEDQTIELTQKGKEHGAEARVGRHGPYILWPENLSLV